MHDEWRRSRAMFSTTYIANRWNKLRGLTWIDRLGTQSINRSLSVYHLRVSSLENHMSSQQSTEHWPAKWLYMSLSKSNTFDHFFNSFDHIETPIVLFVLSCYTVFSLNPFSSLLELLVHSQIIIWKNYLKHYRHFVT